MPVGCRMAPPKTTGRGRDFDRACQKSPRAAMIHSGRVCYLLFAFPLRAARSGGGFLHDHILPQTGRGRAPLPPSPPTRAVYSS